MNPLQKKYKDLLSVVKQLDDFSQQWDYTNIEKAGLVKAFEFCFELSWKLLKKIADDKGLNVATPKDSLRAGFQMGLIANEDLWLQMQKDRNTTAHTYSADYTDALIQDVRQKYRLAFIDLLAQTKKLLDETGN